MASCYSQNKIHVLFQGFQLTPAGPPDLFALHFVATPQPTALPEPALWPLLMQPLLLQSPPCNSVG